MTVVLWNRLPAHLNLNLPSTPNTSIRVLHGVRARMVGIKTRKFIKKEKKKKKK